jgi:ATP-binding cassette subfamily B (MDR/TAP) protein 1
MSVFTSEDIVARGNFISLMFFVMSLGILVIYFVMGWSTNTIAQVRASVFFARENDPYSLVLHSVTDTERIVS